MKKAVKEQGIRGSKARCLELTSRDPNEVASILNRLVFPFAEVDPMHDIWMPKGFSHQKEAMLDKDTCAQFLSVDIRRKLRDWWLIYPAKTPTWDLVSTCLIDGKRGLIAVEAKAHDDEAKVEGKGEDEDASLHSQANHSRIGSAIAEANVGLNSIIPGWSLSRDNHYQLCNRFAWTWKIATFGVPMVLVYLGFLNASEMVDVGHPFDSILSWEKYLRDYTKSIVPVSAWGKKLQTSEAPMFAVITSLELEWAS
jgi:hypothetical protein